MFSDQTTMEPVFTIPYPEFVVADRLRNAFPRKHGYGVFIPASRQQEGFDLMLAKTSGPATRCVTIQVKASRMYPADPQKSGRFAYNFWFKRFKPHPSTQLFVFVCPIPHEPKSARARAPSVWKPVLVCLTQPEMDQLLRNARTKTGENDTHFSFGVGTATEVFLTRGSPDAEGVDHSRHLLEGRVQMITKLFE